MEAVLLIIIAITAVISIIAFGNMNIFEKYKFNVSAIQQRKENIRLLSSGFLHADWTHLIFNMMTLYFFGPIVIKAFSAVGFLIIYFASIVLGNLFSLFIYKKQGWYSAIGASGGVSGILFAAIAIYPSIGIGFMFIPIPIPGYIFGFLYFGYSVYMMLNPNRNDNIGHASHLGGAFFGLIYALLFQLEIVMSHALQLIIMAIPLLYLGYEIIIKKRIG